MLFAGIDVGAGTIKIAVVQGGRLVEFAIAPAGPDPQAALAEAWGRIKADRAGLKAVAATGSGARGAAGAHGLVSEAAAAARGAVALFPEARAVIDVGAEEGRAVKMDAAGRVTDFLVNEKCAAGAGAFVESMARALEATPEELGRLSLSATGAVAMNAQCAVFAESEVVALLHANTPKPDIAKAVLSAIADRIVAMARRLGIAEGVALIGGLARNAGFVQALNRGLGTEVMVPEVPEAAAALGAALLAAEGGLSPTEADQAGQGQGQ